MSVHPRIVQRRRERLSCGHHSYPDSCEECAAVGPAPDPWLCAEDPDRLYRAEQTRAYRQSKARNRGA